jgi:hypothetical protein
MVDKRPDEFETVDVALAVPRRHPVHYFSVVGDLVELHDFELHGCLLGWRRTATVVGGVTVLLVSRAASHSSTAARR